MIVCICRGASDRTIQHLIDDGARSIADFQQCGVGDCCGSCHGMLRKMLAADAAERAAAAAASPVCGDAPAAVSYAHEGR